jgi:WD40 repeat protein/serine/threonine protein kinase
MCHNIPNYFFISPKVELVMTIPNFNSYTLDTIITNGQYTASSRATHGSLNRTVVIKFLKSPYISDPNLAAQLQIESQNLVNLEHPYMIRLLEFLDYSEAKGLVFAHYSSTLADKMEGELASIQLTAHVLMQIGAALQHLHSKHIIHGTVCPELISLDDNDNAFLAGTALNQAWCLDNAYYRNAVSTWRLYAAPELIHSQELTVQSDIYSLATVTLHWLTGHYSLRDLPADDAKKLPRPLFSILQKALDPKPKQRFSDMQRFVAEFQAAMPTKGRSPAQPLAKKLTKRELEIVELMTLNLSDAQIAERLGIEASTVGVAIRREIFKKLGENSRQRAIDHAIELGLTFTSKTHHPDASGAKSDSLPFTNPYKGLQAFEEGDTNTFFGRDEYVQRLIEKLINDTRFITLIGPSGSGKSSLINAGLLPAIRQSPNFEKWLITRIVPTANPIEELAIALTKVNKQANSELLRWLNSNSDGLSRACSQLLPANQHAEFLLIVDQFEGLFTLVGDEGLRMKFITLISEAVSNPHSRVRIILGLSADYYDRPLQYPQLAELMRACTEVIIPMSPQQLEKTIVEPAKRIGLNFETGLVSQIVQDVYNRPGALPLLQHTMNELFEMHQGKTITLENYRTIGGIIGSLGHRAEELYNKELNKSGRIAAKELFYRLITVDLSEEIGFTLRYVPKSELYSSSEKNRCVDEVLQLFAKYRLLIFDTDNQAGIAIVQISHEALLSNWERLKNWSLEWRDSLLLYKQLNANVAEWLKENKNASHLVSGTKLLRYESLIGEQMVKLSTDEQDFIDSSIRERLKNETFQAQLAQKEAALRKRIVIAQRLLIAVLSVSLLIASFLFFWAHMNQDLAVQQAQIALSHQLAAQALAEIQNPVGNDEYAALLAIQSMQIAYEPVADESLVRAVERLPLGLVLQHENGIQSLAYSQDGQRLLIGDIVGNILILNLQTGLVESQWTAHNDRVWDLQFSRDGNSVLSTGGNSGIVKLWDLSTQSALRDFADDQRVQDLQFSSNNDFVLTGSTYGSVKLWSVLSGEAIITIDNLIDTERDEVYSLALTPDEQYLLAGGGSGRASLWDINSGERIRNFEGHTNDIYTIAVSPDSQLLTTGSADNSAMIWDINTGQVIHRLLGHSNSVRKISFSPDGQFVLTGSGDGTARLWDVESGEELRSMRGHRGRVNSAIFSPDGSSIITGSEDGTVKIWQGPNEHGLYQLNPSDVEVYGVAFSPDNRYLATIGSDTTVKLWDFASLDLLQEFSGHTMLGTSVEFSPDGNFLVSGSLDETARLWDIATGETRVIFPASGGEVWSVDFSPDGQQVLTNNIINEYDNAVRLWDSQNGELLHRYTGFATFSLKAIISNDNRYVAAGGQDITVHIWDKATASPIRNLTGHENEITALAFSPDSRLLASASRDRSIMIWNIEAGEALQTLRGHNNTVTAVEFSPDGHYLVTASSDRTARIWDWETGIIVRTLAGHQNALWDLAISSDGQFIVTAGLDGTLRVWDFNYQTFIDKVCNSLSRDFTEQERELAHLTNSLPTCIP